MFQDCCWHKNYNLNLNFDRFRRFFDYLCSIKFYTIEFHLIILLDFKMLSCVNYSVGIGFQSIDNCFWASLVDNRCFCSSGDQIGCPKLGNHISCGYHYWFGSFHLHRHLSLFYSSNLVFFGEFRSSYYCYFYSKFRYIAHVLEFLV